VSGRLFSGLGGLQHNPSSTRLFEYHTVFWSVFTNAFRGNIHTLCSEFIDGTGGPADSGVARAQMVIAAITIADVPCGWMGSCLENALTEALNFATGRVPTKSSATGRSPALSSPLRKMIALACRLGKHVMPSWLMPKRNVFLRQA
jgi:hypothetical protein